MKHLMVIALAATMAACASFTPYERCTGRAYEELIRAQRAVDIAERDLERGYVVHKTRESYQCVKYRPKTHEPYAAVCYRTIEKPVGLDRETLEIRLEAAERRLAKARVAAERAEITCSNLS